MNDNIFLRNSTILDKSIIIDTGSASTKSGFSDDIIPKSVCPTVIGYPSRSREMTDMKDSALEYYIGENALNKRRVKTLRFPFSRNQIVDWESMERIWHHIFYNDLKTNPQYNPILLVEPQTNKIAFREKVAEIMFELFCVPSLYFATAAQLCLYATGRITGLVIDIGETKTDVIPYYQGFIIAHATHRLDVGGDNITNYLQKLLSIRNNVMKKRVAKQWSREIKENMSYVSLNFEKELRIYQNGRNKHSAYYMFPDGEQLEVGSERIQAVEILFQPNLDGLPNASLADSIIESIEKCDRDIRSHLYSNIILSGGSSIFPGLEQRIYKELKKKIPTNVEINIIAPPDRAFLTWIGGSIFSSINTFPNLWLSRQKYRKNGLEAFLN